MTAPAEEAQQAAATLTHPARRIIEALLFASKEPLAAQKIKDVMQHYQPLSIHEIRREVEELQREYEQEERAFQIEEIANGYLLRSNPSYHPYLQLLFKAKRTEKLSHASLETLAIIAYKQPITKAQIEMIRGVDCSGVLHVLQEKGLVEMSGKLEAPGRPSLFVTTTEFLKYFGINDLSCLPQVETELPAQ